MTPLLPAVLGAITLLGLLGAGLALRPHTPQPRRVRPPSAIGTRLAALSPRSRTTLAGSVAAGVVLSILTGWVAAIVILPAAALGLPYLLADPPAVQRIRRVEAMKEWTASLAGVLGVGIGIEQAITATLASTPDPIKPEVTTLVARLRARWDTATALRAFAEDLDDATGDLITLNLILAARNRNRNLSSVLQGVAKSVAEDVDSRRRVEAGRAKPRGSARLVTIFSLGVLAILAFTGDYVAPYFTPIGEVILLFLLTAYGAALAWMRKMSDGKPLARILGPTAAAGAR